MKKITKTGLKALINGILIASAFVIASYLPKEKNYLISSKENCQELVGEEKTQISEKYIEAISYYLEKECKSKISDLEMKISSLRYQYDCKIEKIEELMFTTSTFEGIVALREYKNKKSTITINNVGQEPIKFYVYCSTPAEGRKIKMIYIPLLTRKINPELFDKYILRLEDFENWYDHKRDNYNFEKVIEELKQEKESIIEKDIKGIVLDFEYIK